MDQSNITVKELIDMVREEVHRRFDSQDAVLRDIRAEVKMTNGRVSALEKLTAILEDRSPTNPKREAKALGLGGIIAGMGYYLWERFHK